MSTGTIGRLRIGLVCPYSFDRPGGVQNHVRGLARYLRSQGHETHILAPGDFSAIDGEPAQQDRFTSAGAAVAVRYNGSTARVNFGPLSAARVRRWLYSGDFDLIHIHEPITPSISMLALWATDVPVVATFHTATPRSRSMQLAGGALRAAIEKIDAGIAVSESARKVVVQHLGRDAVVIPNGFWFTDFAGLTAATSPTRKSKASTAAEVAGWRGGDRPRLSFLGRVDEPRKGLDVLLAALPQIRASFPDLETVITGQGSRRLPAHCRALGTVTEGEKAQTLATSDVFVAPHLARESFGIVLLEAMASGAAVVASDLPAFADLLAGGNTGGLPQLGYTFPVGDVAALAATVLQVLASRDNRLAQQARNASRGYDWSVVGASIADVYLACLAGSGVKPTNRAIG